MSITASKIKAILYCRVSSKEQEETGYSLPSQEKLLKDYAARKGFTVTKTFSVAESASGEKQRKIFDEMIRFAEKYKITNILCEKVDRLTRNLKDAVTVNDWIEKNPERQIHFVKTNLVIHKDAKSDEKFRWDIEIVLAKKYIANLSEEVRKGQKEKIAQGWLPTKPPLGYHTIGDKGHKTHIIDNAVAPLMRQMFEWYATGNYSVLRIWKELHEAGLRSRSGRMVPTSRIHKLLTNPFYYGKMRWIGQIYPGKHDPIISKDLFDKVQSILKRKTKNPHLSKHNLLFKGMIFCEHCGGMLTWETQKEHQYGHCNNNPKYRDCPQKTYIREEKVEEQIISCFEMFAPKNKKVLEWIEGIIKEEHSQKISSRENEVGRLRELLDRIRRRKDLIYEDKIDGIISLETYNKKFSEYTTEENNLESSLSRISDNSDEYQNLGVAIHELAYQAKEIYKKATIDEKRLLMRQIFTNIVQDGHKIKPKFTLAAEYLSNWIPKLNQDYEPEKTLTTKEKTGVSTPVHPMWLRR